VDAYRVSLLHLLRITIIFQSAPHAGTHAIIISKEQSARHSPSGDSNYGYLLKEKQDKGTKFQREEDAS
jgi:hypothetical protein